VEIPRALPPPDPHESDVDRRTIYIATLVVKGLVCRAPSQAGHQEEYAELRVVDQTLVLRQLRPSGYSRHLLDKN
jgi:hypothetical protein